MLDDSIKNNQNLVNSLKEKIKADKKEKDELKSSIKRIQDIAKDLPKRTEYYYSLYVDFCENVISKLLVEDLTKAIKNFKEDFE
jgi:molecular chaperone GrpE (heat shock protein)